MVMAIINCDDNGYNPKCTFIETNKMVTKKLKHHSKQFRKIKGVYFECRTADSCKFVSEINEAKLKNLKYRIIKNQFYFQVNNQGD
jgi:hypothetical protein